MNNKTITKDDIRGFSQHLEHDEKSQATIDKYHRDVMAFWAVVGGEPLTKEIVMAYKKHLIEQSYAISSINSMLASVGSFSLWKEKQKLYERFGTNKWRSIIWKQRL